MPILGSRLASFLATVASQFCHCPTLLMKFIGYGRTPKPAGEMPMSPKNCATHPICHPVAAFGGSGLVKWWVRRVGSRGLFKITSSQADFQKSGGMGCDFDAQKELEKAIHIGLSPCSPTSYGECVLLGTIIMSVMRGIFASLNHSISMFWASLANAMENVINMPSSHVNCPNQVLDLSSNIHGHG